MDRAAKNRRHAVKVPPESVSIVDRDSSYKQVLVAGRSRSSSMQSESSLVKEQAEDSSSLAATLQDAAAAAVQMAESGAARGTNNSGRPPRVSAAGGHKHSVGHRSASPASVGSAAGVASSLEHPDLQPAVRRDSGKERTEALEERVAELEQEAAARQQELQKLQRMYSASDMSRKMLQSVHNDLCKDYATVEETLRKAAEANAGLAAALDATRAEMKQAQDRESCHLRAMEEQQQLYRHDINCAYADLQTLERKVTEGDRLWEQRAQAQGTKHAQEVSALQQELARLQQRCASLEAESSSSPTTGAQSMQHHTSALATLKAEVDMAAMQRSALQVSLAAQQVTVQELESKLRRSEQDRELALTRARVLHDETTVLTRRLKNIEDEHSQMSAQVSEYREELQLVNGKWGAAAAEAQSLQVAFLRSRDQKQAQSEEFHAQRKAALEEMEKKFQAQERLHLERLEAERAAHALALRAVQSELDSQRAIVQRITTAEGGSVQHVGRGAMQEHMQALEALKAGWAKAEARYKQQMVELQSALDSDRASHSAALSVVKQGHEKEVAEIGHRYALREQELRVSLGAVEARLDELRATHAVAMDSLRAEHAVALAGAKAEVMQTREDVSKGVAQVKVLEAEKEALQATWQLRERQLCTELAEAEGALSSLRAEVEKLRVGVKAPAGLEQALADSERKLASAMHELVVSRQWHEAEMEGERKATEGSWQGKVLSLQALLVAAQSDAADARKTKEMMRVQVERLAARVHDLESLLLEAVARRDATQQLLDRREHEAQRLMEEHEKHVASLEERHEQELRDSGVRGMALLRQHWEESGLQKAQLQASIAELQAAVVSSQKELGDVTNELQVCIQQKVQLQRDLEDTQAVLTALAVHEVGGSAAAQGEPASMGSEELALVHVATDLADVVRELKAELQVYRAEGSSPGMRMSSPWPEGVDVALLPPRRLSPRVPGESANSADGEAVPTVRRQAGAAASPLVQALTPPIPPLPASAGMRAWRRVQRSPKRQGAQQLPGRGAMVVDCL